MKTSISTTTILSAAVIFTLNHSSLQSAYADHHEGAHKHSEGSHKKHAEGSHKKHSEGSHKKHAEGSHSGDNADAAKAAQDAMMAKWHQYATPAENHKTLDAFVGSWKYKVSMRMSPDAKPEISEGTSESKWILGGRFVQQSVSGVSMGQQFEGIGIIGYDNAKGEYDSMWIDSMGTGMMRGTGTFDTKSKTLTEKGTFSCPFRGGESKFRTNTIITNANSYTMEMYGPDIATGEEFKSMEITYTRK